MCAAPPRSSRERQERTAISRAATRELWRLVPGLVLAAEPPPGCTALSRRNFASVQPQPPPRPAHWPKPRYELEPYAAPSINQGAVPVEPGISYEEALATMDKLLAEAKTPRNYKISQPKL